MPSSDAIASAMPPLAVPSSFVRTTPVTPAASAKARAWRRPFWPVVASITISVSCGAPTRRLCATRRILASSSIRLPWVWSRPAVSMITTSAPRASAAVDRVEDDGARVAARLPLDDLGARALRPGLELLDRRRAVGVGGTDDRAPPKAGRHQVGELADRGRLARPVHADDHDHRRPVGQVDPRRSVRLGHLGQELDEAGAGRVALRDRAATTPPPRARPTTSAVTGAPTSARISASSRRSNASASRRSKKLAETSAVSAWRLRERLSRRREKNPDRAPTARPASGRRSPPPPARTGLPTPSPRGGRLDPQRGRTRRAG